MGDQELRLISGIATDLVVHSGEEEFVRSAGQQAVGAAAGLAPDELAGASAGASIAATTAGDSVEFFSCKVDGQVVSGRFSKASFKAGDQVEMIVLTRGNLVQAVRRTSDHMLWMAPHFSRGQAAHAQFSRYLTVKLLLGLLAVGAMFIVLMEYTVSSTPFEFVGFDAALIGSMATIAAPYFSFRFYRQWLPIAKQAEAIFAALGYPDPTRVDLPRDHMRYCKAHGIEWPYLTDGPWIYHYLDPQGMPISTKSGTPN